MKGFDRKGWKKVTFGEVCRNLNISERDPLAAGIERYVGLEHIEPENLHIKSWGSVADGTTFTKKFQAGHVLFGKRRAYQKKAAVADFAGISSGDILVLEAIESVLDQRLLPFIVRADRFFEYAVQTSAGSLSPRTKFQDLAKYSFLLPPKEEQAQLAQLLWAGDEVVEKYSNLDRRLAEYRTTLIDSCFNDREYDKDWRILTLRECCTIQTGIAKGKKYHSNNSLLEVPYLSVANVQDGHISTAGIKTIKVLEHEVLRYKLEPSDVLIAEGGDFDKVGRGAVWNGAIDPCLHQNHVFAIRPDRKIVLPEFLSFQTGSTYGKKYFLGCAKKTSNLASINSSQVKAFPLIIPSISEQHSLIQKVISLERSLETLRLQSNEMKQSQKLLINQIFSS